MLGSDSSVTDYPGKIPKGIDLPSDAVVDDNNIKVEWFFMMDTALSSTFLFIYTQTPSLLYATLLLVLLLTIELKILLLTYWVKDTLLVAEKWISGSH